MKIGRGNRIGVTQCHSLHGHARAHKYKMPVSIASSVTFGIHFYFWVLHPVACIIKDIRSAVPHGTSNILWYSYWYY
jgi:hypothetical protein